MSVMGQERIALQERPDRILSFGHDRDWRHCHRVVRCKILILTSYLDNEKNLPCLDAESQRLYAQTSEEIYGPFVGGTRRVMTTEYQPKAVSKIT